MPSPIENNTRHMPSGLLVESLGQSLVPCTYVPPRQNYVGASFLKWFVLLVVLGIAL